MRISQEVIDIHQARPGDDALVANVPEAGGKITQQLDIKLRAGSKISVAALGREDVVRVTIPRKPRLAESSTCRNHRLVAGRCDLHATKRDEVSVLQAGDPPCIRLEIVDQNGRRKM